MASLRTVESLVCFSKHTKRSTLDSNFSVLQKMVRVIESFLPHLAQVWFIHAGLMIPFISFMRVLVGDCVMSVADDVQSFAPWIDAPFCFKILI